MSQSIIPNAEYTRRYVYRTKYQIVWSTFHQLPAFTTAPLKTQMKHLLLTIAANNQIEIDSISISDTSIELTVSFPPRKSATNVVKAFKGRSSRLFLQNNPNLKATFVNNHLWSSSYYFGTLGHPLISSNSFLSDARYNKHN